MGSNVYDSVDRISCDVSGVSGGGSVPPQSQLVLDCAKGELVKAPARVVKKTTSEAKALAALKNHSEAEKRRRQRINAHLSTLRGLVPSTDKMDKATLLAEVITHMKDLQKKALETCQGLLLPMDTDEVTVEPLPSEDIHRNAFRVSLCFKYRHDILVDLRQAIGALRLRILKMEMSTFEEWLKVAFIFTTTHELVDSGNETKMSSIHRALSSVLEKNSSAYIEDYSPGSGATLARKRRRVSLFESSSSSS